MAPTDVFLFLDDFVIRRILNFFFKSELHFLQWQHTPLQKLYYRSCGLLWIGTVWPCSGSAVTLALWLFVLDIEHAVHESSWIKWSVKYKRQLFWYIDPHGWLSLILLNHKETKIFLLLLYFRKRKQNILLACFTMTFALLFLL